MLKVACSILLLTIQPMIFVANHVVCKNTLGAVLDDQDRKLMERISPRTVDRMDRLESLTINDIIKLSQGGVSDDTILLYLEKTSSSYNLNQTQLRRLRDAGVSQRVIRRLTESSK